MVHEDAVADRKLDVTAGLGNDAGRFVPQHERRFAPDVPAHDVAAANPARHRAHENLTIAKLGDRSFLDPDVVNIVEDRSAHGSRVHGSIKTLSPMPESSLLNASAISPRG